MIDLAAVPKKSKRAYLDFQKRFTGLNPPVISLTPDNEIYISWRDRGEILSIRFLANGGIHYVMFTPDEKIRGTVATFKDLETVMKSNKWIKE